MIAHKFLRPGALGPFSGFSWPVPSGGEPGAWVEAAPEPCASGIHACRLRDLPFWLLDELWVTELDGPTVELPRSIVAARGRLVRRVDGWDDGARRAYCEACADVVRAAAADARSVGPEVSLFIDDAVARVDVGSASTIAARAAEHGLDGGSDGERLRQARWLAERLGLDGDL